MTNLKVRKAKNGNKYKLLFSKKYCITFLVIIFSAMKIPVILFQKWPKKYFVMPLQLRQICFYEELFQTAN